MRLPSLLSERRFRGLRIAAVALVASGALAWAFDWTWLRPLIQHQVMSRSGRRVDFEALRVSLGPGFDPVIEVDGLRVENAAWASSKAPLVVARRVRVELAWRTLFSEMRVIRRLTLVDAAVELERRANGQRNWRLQDPQGFGVPRYRILSLEPRQGRLHLLNAGIDLDLTIRSTPLAAAAVLPGHPDVPLTQRLAFEATWHGLPLAGELDASDRLTFQQTDRDFALRGAARVGSARLQAGGLAADLFAGARLDLDLQLVAPRPEDLRSLASGARDPTNAPDARWPALAKVAAQAHLNKAADRWTFAKLQATIGRSDLAGELVFDRARGESARSRLQARLDAQLLDLADFGLPGAPADAARQAGLPRRPFKGRTDGARGADASGAMRDPAPRIASAATPSVPASAGFTGLRRLDATLDLHAARVAERQRTWAEALRLHAALDAGRLRLAPFAAMFAGGQLSGNATLDAARDPAESAFELRWSGVDLDRLPVGDAAARGIVGRVAGHAALRAQGDSPRALLRSASGTLTATLAGARIPRRLDAELGLDAGGFLRSLLPGAAAVPVRCAEIALELHAGRASIQRLAFDTERTAVSGRGSIDLLERTLDVTLAPRSRVGALLALHKNLHLRGPLAAPKLGLEPPDATPAPAASCDAAAR